jgi:two-component system response regulator DevR
MQGSVSSDRRAVTDKLRVVVVDDHEVARRGITDLLNEADDITVVGQASTAEQALARVAVLLPDVAVLDVRLPDGSGVDVCRELRSRCPQVQCLMLTSFPDEQTMLDAFLAGAAGFVLKDITGVDLVGAVRSVGSGRSLLDPLAAAVLVGRLRSAAPPPGPLAGLTDHERTTLELIGEGLTNRQIAGRMFVAEKTVKNYVSHLLAKLGMGTRTQIAVLATQVRANQAEASRWADPGSRSGAPRTPRPGERTGR